jgi:hypothetical protein
MKVMSPLPLVAVLAVLACGCDAPASSRGAAASSTAAGAASAPSGCAGLAAHWRDVWAAAGRPGLERRASHAADRAAAAWSRACAEVAAAPPSAADMDVIRGIKSFAALKAMDAASSKGSLAPLVKAAQSAAITTEQAFDAAPPSGVVECEDALVDAAFCGDDVDRASVKSAAKGKDDGACTALGVLLAKKCAQQ